MSKYYTLEEVRVVRNKISELGERRFPLLEEEWDKARAERNKAMAERDNVGAKWSKAVAERDKAVAEYDKARAEYDIKLFDTLIVICPEAYYWDWRGYIAIPKSKKDDWIVPVFSGDYKGVKHKAFPIWEMPKDSYDERNAKEV
ncbi:MAG: hypothetical protein DDT23_00368 [candidate division WS2 bacterium]|nr:hypothetical protein [Candidatus Lithacetigena glycinireducens]